MKRAMLVLAALAVLVGGAAQTVYAVSLAGDGHIFELWFDENGNSRYSQNGGPITIGSSTYGLNDAFSGLAGVAVLTYALPETIVAGDVRVWEDAQATILSDLMRFYNDQGHGFMIYYSDAGDTDLADSGFPSTLNPNDGGGIFETGSEAGIAGFNGNGFDWFPGGNIYHGISDVPGPATLILLGLGIAGMAGYGWRRKQR